MSEAELEPRRLARRWLHAHEEDEPGTMVLRPAERPLPRSRGRVGLDLRPDGTLVESRPGPADAPEEASGTWELDGRTLVLHREGSPDVRLPVRALEEDRLVLDR